MYSKAIRSLCLINEVGNYFSQQVNCLSHEIKNFSSNAPQKKDVFTRGFLSSNLVHKILPYFVDLIITGKMPLDDLMMMFTANIW